jgi:soluble lytic murein transglycosylase-like protein
MYKFLLFVLIFLIFIPKTEDRMVTKVSSPCIHDIIISKSRKHNIDYKMVLAIFQVESNLDIKAYNKRTKDYGIAQINIRNIKKLNLNAKKLITDPEYSVEEGIKLLNFFKDKYETKLGHKWIAKYNCGMRNRCENTKKSKIYIKKVYKIISRYMLTANPKIAII